jgi:N-acylneuraminate cytidylyltransferase/CMP-N,N'-diacetyllegionaminic acid synthase
MITIIPARCGSKGLPGKNIKNLLGKPMIAYTIEEALKSKYIRDVIISTDCKEIEDVALQYGAKSFFLRPDELATDSSKAIDNYVYTVERLNGEFGFDIKEFVVLQPTSPLRRTEDIDGAIELFKRKNAESVISYVEEQHPIEWHKYLLEDGRLECIFEDKLQNRQEVKKSYYPNGAVYVFNFDLIKSGRYYSDKTLAYIMPRERSVDIDTIDDFKYVEFLMKVKNEQ